MNLLEVLRGAVSKCAFEVSKSGWARRSHTVSPSRIYLFGSRVTGEARLKSDYDFAFDAPDADSTALQTIRNDLGQLHTLYRIDVANIAE